LSAVRCIKENITFALKNDRIYKTAFVQRNKDKWAQLGKDLPLKSLSAVFLFYTAQVVKLSGGDFSSSNEQCQLIN
jgi:hypothetical protein